MSISSGPYLLASGPDPVYLCSSAAAASLPAQPGSSVVYTVAGSEGPTASLPAKQGNITKSDKLEQQEVSRTACPKIRSEKLSRFLNSLSWYAEITLSITFALLIQHYIYDLTVPFDANVTLESRIRSAQAEPDGAEL